MNNEDYLEKLRHSTSHVMAQAVLELFPGTKLAIGPAIEDGFYYDFDSSHRFIPEDLQKIETRMAEIVKGNHAFVRSPHTKAEAREHFTKQGEPYKLEILEEIPFDEITYYQHDSFVDLCEGPHVDDTSHIKHFKLLKIAGAYWRGDEKREQLQRIYGTVWPTKEELDAYLWRLEESKKRDHRELGPALKYFSIEPDLTGSGLILWHPKGARVRMLIEQYLRELHLNQGYEPVSTPHIGLANLWQTSGHLDFYSANMYAPIDVEGSRYYIKPMNCPFHIAIYKSSLHSYRELPLKLFELGTVYRFERSGVLHGLLRVRGFTQDDAHIFCRTDQLENEVIDVLKLTGKVLSDFGFKDYLVKLSTRPKEYVGTLAMWEKAENALAQALKTTGIAYDLDPGEGVFYGPKIDLKIKDCLGRPWQCSTIQVDFNLPERFGVTYRNQASQDELVCMVHRAVLGSVERFFGILLEHYAGALPVWLAPVQAMILPIANRHEAYAKRTKDLLATNGIRAECDTGSQPLNARIRNAILGKAPYVAVCGDREETNNSLSVRKRPDENLGAMPVPDFINYIHTQITEKH